MKTIRHNVFETNSSSEHVFVVTNKSIWERFEKGELIYDLYADDGDELKESSKIAEEIKTQYEWLSPELISEIITNLCDSGKRKKFQKDLNALIRRFNFEGYDHQFFTYENFSDITHNFDYGDTNIKIDGNKVEAYLEWYE